MNTTFKTSFLGAPKNSLVKNYFPPFDPTPPSQSLGIDLKISPITPFEIKKIALSKLAIFKLLKSLFSLNIYF